jgi:CHAT domain-containing protein/tetratricopeptide (TPR) repeat protein
MLPWCAAACAVVLSALAGLQEQGEPAGAAPTPAIDQALEQGERLLQAARAADQAHDPAGARAAVRSACELLDGVAGARDSADVALFLSRLGRVAADARDLEGARRAWEWSATYFERARGVEDEDLLFLQNRLAGIGYLEGNLVAARALMERVVTIHERTKPRNDKRLLDTQLNLAIVKNVLGDVPGSLAILEEVLAIREQELPRDHQDLLSTLHNHAIVLRQMGEYERALEELERVRAAHQAAVQTGELAPTSRSVLDTKIAVAHTLSSMGRAAEAQKILERVSEGLAGLPREHLDVVRVDALRACIRLELGDLAGARALNAERLAVYERCLPRDHADRLRARGDLAANLAALGEWSQLLTQLEQLTGELDLWVQNCLLVSPREARERASRMSERLAPLISYTELAKRESAGDAALGKRAAQLERSVCELIETVRSVTAGAVSLAAVTSIDPALVELREQSTALREEVSVLVRQGGEKRGLARAIEERDRIEERLRKRLYAAGLVAPSIRLDALAAALPPGTAAIGFRRYPRVTVDREAPNRTERRDWLLAHVLRPNGKLVRVDLGPCDEIDAKVRRWRTAVGKTLQRGVTLTPEAEAIQQETGVALRQVVLDPVLAAAGDVTTLHVCLDDVLHLVPLSALPLDTARKEHVGDRFEMLYETSFARLLQQRPPRDDEGGTLRLVAVGGINFNACSTEAAYYSSTDAVAPPVEAAYRGEESDSSRSALWAPLPQTKHEAESIAALFEEIFDGKREIEPVLLTRKAATKRALVQSAPGAQYLHLATHGYFAGESVLASARDQGDADLWPSVGRSDRGLAPMALCGLALAGANLGMNAAGHVPGILTAEELAGFDLSSCELAVLSACETNVGIRRAGLGIQSLQAALHAAGAKTAITTLWKVDDDAARELMTTFYTLYWSDRGLTKARALWEAQVRMRKTWPLREWSGWVLTGDPR